MRLRITHGPLMQGAHDNPRGGGGREEFGAPRKNKGKMHHQWEGEGQNTAAAVQGLGCRIHMSAPKHTRTHARDETKRVSVWEGS
jgi:hypothetical protein